MRISSARPRSLILVAATALVAVPAASADLEPGSQGSAVDRLTARLAELRYLSEDHVGSHYTRAVGWAVTAFQKQEEIGVDGIVAR